MTSIQANTPRFVPRRNEKLEFTMKKKERISRVF